MYSDDIWNDLELQRKHENNVSKAYILKVFGTIWNCREKNENNVSKECILEMFETI